MGIVVFGTVFVDIKGYPFGPYIPAGRNAGTVVQVHGGVSRNVVEDIANLELRPTFISVVDESALGTEVIENLKKHKVNTDYIKRKPGGMGTWLAVFDERGDIVASISKRPEVEDIAEICELYGDEIMKNCDSISVEFDMEREVLNPIFDLAEKYNKKVYAVISNVSIAAKRRDLLKKCACFVCNQQEAGLLFADNFDDCTPEEMKTALAECVSAARIPSMVVTMGENGAVYAAVDGESGIVPPQRVGVQDTTGAGDAFFAGVAVGLTYGKKLTEACEIGTRLAASVITTKQNVCPRFLPEEFGISVPVRD